MLRLTLRQQFRIFLWQHRRNLVLGLCTVLASMLLLCGNQLQLADPTLTPLLTMAQLAAGALIVLLILVICD